MHLDGSSVSAPLRRECESGAYPDPGQARIRGRRASRPVGVAAGTHPHWLGRFFERLFGFVAQYPTESRIFFWTLIGGAVLAFLVWLFRRWDRAELVLMNIPSDATSAHFKPVDSGGPRVFRAGRLPESDPVHVLGGHCSAGGTRYASAKPAAHAARIFGSGFYFTQWGPSQYSAPLAALTTQLERCWYAGMTATAQDFSACLSALEAFGCRVD